MPDREAEIRADERRRVIAELRAEAERRKFAPGYWWEQAARFLERQPPDPDAPREEQR